MRETQIFGLPALAKKFIKDNVQIVPMDICKNCGHVVTTKRNWEVYKDASYTGMFEDGPNLLCYTLKDGNKVYEEIQTTPWSSGPCIFLRLVDEDKKILFEWDDEKIGSVI